jgi:hypothetical protein
MTPTQRIVAEVIKESKPGGRSTSYFLSQVAWERDMRNSFESVKVGLTANDPEVMSRAQTLFRGLNHDYHRPYPILVPMGSRLIVL